MLSNPSKEGSHAVTADDVGDRRAGAGRRGQVAVEVKLTVAESAGVARAAEPVTSGVPFAKGAVKDVANLALADAAGKPLPAQFTRLAPGPTAPSAGRSSIRRWTSRRTARLTLLSRTANPRHRRIPF